MQNDFFELSDGDIQVSIHDESSIHLRAITKLSDPVELSSEAVRELIALLSQLVERVD
jgi:hypothetical protein